MTKASDEGFDAKTDTDSGDLVQQAHYDRAGRYDLTTTIIVAIADAEGVSPTDLKSPVLYECVDVAALEDAFFGSTVAVSVRDGVGSVEFHFGDYRIVVKSDGWVSVYE